MFKLAPIRPSLQNVQSESLSLADTARATPASREDLDSRDTAHAKFLPWHASRKDPDLREKLIGAYRSSFFAGHKYMPLIRHFMNKTPSKYAMLWWRIQTCLLKWNRRLCGSSSFSLLLFFFLTAFSTTQEKRGQDMKHRREEKT